MTEKEKKYPLWTKTKHEQIFFDKIKEYNKMKTFYTHCIRVDNEVLVINFHKRHWEFDVYPLEDNNV